MKIRIAVVREVDPDNKSEIIMEVIDADFSHILIIYEEGHRDMVFHATKKGVHKLELTEYLKDHIIVKEKTVELLKSRDYFLGYVKGSNGKEYGTEQLPGT